MCLASHLLVHPPPLRDKTAVGARGRNILARFATDAVTLSLVGGAIGVLPGAAATALVRHFADWQVSMTASSVALAAGFSAFVGALFGWYPARRASRLQTFQALRQD
jgi:putative ABC transport system permease protein